MQWQDSLEQHLCIGLESGGLLAGFSVAMLLPDEAELLLIAVEPACHKQGYGQCLLAALRHEFRSRNLERLILEVRESNVPARRFYTAAGFIEIGRRKAYYPGVNGREDALLYCCALTEASA